jgi:hypothetical protein
MISGISLYGLCKLHKLTLARLCHVASAHRGTFNIGNQANQPLDSIEGSAITVAACIPVLQPLVETCLGYRFGGDALGLREKDDSEHGGGRHRIFESDLSPTRHREVRDPNGLSFLNSTKANTNAEITRIASEDPTIDTIVESDGKPGTSSTVETADGIKRTDKYSVSYAGKESVSEEEQQRWKRGF